MVMDAAVAVAAGIDGPGELHPLGVLQQTGMVAADHAEADDGSPQRRAFALRTHRRAQGYRPTERRPVGPWTSIVKLVVVSPCHRSVGADD